MFALYPHILVHPDPAVFVSIGLTKSGGDEVWGIDRPESGRYLWLAGTLALHQLAGTLALHQLAGTLALHSAYCAKCV